MFFIKKNTFYIKNVSVNIVKWYKPLMIFGYLFISNGSTATVGAAAGGVSVSIFILKPSTGYFKLQKININPAILLI